ncbi:hypothetical protein [Rhodococcus sp. NPDC058521]|uniref:hypothetical protein n=1 Tax=Rhodococcus sp. NPDC058521 TaxID=3346536 RepID=UPI00366647BD
MTTPIPRPGAHLPGQTTRSDSAASVDPEAIHAQVDGLLSKLGDVIAEPEDQHGSSVIPRKAHLLEQAHEVLVEALSTVDKV